MPQLPVPPSVPKGDSPSSELSFYFAVPQLSLAFCVLFWLVVNRSVFLPDSELLQDRDLPSFSLHPWCPARSPLQSAQVELTNLGKTGAFVMLGEKK